MDDGIVLASTLTVVGIALQLHSMGLPDRQTVRDRPVTPRDVANIRNQCVQTGGASLIIAGAASIATRSWWPLAASALIVGYMWWQFDSAAKQGVLVEPLM